MFTPKKSKWSKIMGFYSADRSFGFNIQSDGSDRVSYEMFKNTIGRKNSLWLRKGEVIWLFELIQDGKTTGELQDKEKTRLLVLAAGPYGEFKITLRKPTPIHDGVTTTLLDFTPDEMNELREIHEKMSTVYNFDVLDVTVEQLTTALLIVWTNRELTSGYKQPRLGAYFNDALAKLAKVLPTTNCPTYPTEFDAGVGEMYVIPSQFEALCTFMGNLLDSLGF